MWILNLGNSEQLHLEHGPQSLNFLNANQHSLIDRLKLPLEHSIYLVF